MTWDYTKDTLPEWCKVGARVYVINHAGWYSRIEYEGKILKIGVRDIVVVPKNRSASQFRFRVSDLTEHRRFGGKLVAPDSPDIRRIRKEERDRQKAIRARKEVEAWNTRKDPLPVIEALTEMVPDPRMRNAIKKAIASNRKERKDDQDTD